MSNDQIVMAFTAIIGMLGQLAIGAFYYGKLSEKVNGHADRLKSLEVSRDDHVQRITRLEATRRATDR